TAGKAGPTVREIPTDTLPPVLDLEHIPSGLREDRPIPPDNSLTASRVALGRRLFFDPILSGDRSVACASCHLPKFAFASPDPVSLGIAGQRGTRNAPSLLNVAYVAPLFWDGRAASLEQQALLPIENPKELGAKLGSVVARLRADAGYVRDFEAAYGRPISQVTLARALASFQRVLVSGNSPVDRFRAGDSSALTTRQRQGLWLFESKGVCWRCHSGRNFTDNRFHNTGVSWGRVPSDLGRYNVTQESSDRGGFKTPTLRNVALTAPYMHDGSLPDLKRVVEFYNRGAGPNDLRDPRIRPLHLTPQEVEQLVAFLGALTGTPLGQPESPASQ
ncbi:MAG: cytochrome c peroxidase, partial [Planctomycetaceae bacterium]